MEYQNYFVDVTEAFQQLIIAPFRQSYAKGQTPNPKGFSRWNLLFKWFCRIFA